jgi:MinD superfamily P-loop ATPase
LSRVTEPTLVSIGESKAGTKLQRAIDKQIPILVVVNKHERSVAGPAL